MVPQYRNRKMLVVVPETWYDDHRLKVFRDIYETAGNTMSFIPAKNIGKKHTSGHISEKLGKIQQDMGHKKMDALVVVDYMSGRVHDIIRSHPGLFEKEVLDTEGPLKVDYWPYLTLPIASFDQYYSESFKGAFQKMDLQDKFQTLKGLGRIYSREMCNYILLLSITEQLGLDLDYVKKFRWKEQLDESRGLSDESFSVVLSKRNSFQKDQLQLYLFIQSLDDQELYDRYYGGVFLRRMLERLESRSGRPTWYFQNKFGSKGPIQHDVLQDAERRRAQMEASI